MNPRPKTLVVDIDGVLLKHHGNLSKQVTEPACVLPGVVVKLNEWNAKGYYIVLMTGRKEGCRAVTEKALMDMGIFFDQLVMGVTGGQRVIINDLKFNSAEPTAVAINVVRNNGISDLCL